MIYEAELARRKANVSTVAQDERRYMNDLVSLVINSAPELARDFEESSEDLRPFWINYPPEQRGRASRGEGAPMLEYGEKVVSSHIISAVSRFYPDIRFAGLPTGGDIRYMTNDAYVHFDVKITGPNEVDNEVVVPPNQVSGDGAIWNTQGIRNNTWPVHYRGGTKSLNFYFQPKLPPIYIVDSKPRICLTFYIKVVYGNEGFGVHPLRHMEIVCVPNGLLMFDNGSQSCALADGLIISGKDDKTTADSSRRIRVKLDPLSKLDAWRSIKIKRHSDGTWKKYYRNGTEVLGIL